MGRLSRKRGVQVERQVARYWGMKRAHFEPHDLEDHPKVTVEVKGRTRPLKGISAWLEQAEAAAEPGKFGIVHYHEMGRKYEDDICILRASALRQLIGDANATAE